MTIKYPIGQQDFERIRKENKIYIDKTGLIYELVDSNSYVFLSRPRRFGKSLLLSTIEAYFQAKRELFEGLNIMKLEKNWKKHAVLHLKLSRHSPSDENSLEALLEEQFRVWEEELEIKEKLGTYGIRFSAIIREAYKKTGEGVVILVDEYDNPLINVLYDSRLHEKNRELLKSIYINFKDMDQYIRFGMLTGVSRFSKTSIFSALNNLKDITFNPKFESICGFTEDEIKEFLWEGVRKLAEKRDCSAEEALTLLKDQYDGYHFSENLLDIYNPFSLLNALDDAKIDNYWHRTGLPDFLARKLKESNSAFSKIFNTEASEYKLAESDTSFSSPVALLYQTGYLTIKGYNQEDNEYYLGIPNSEVEKGLFLFLMGAYMEQDSDDGNRTIREMAGSLKSGDPDGFLKRLQAFIASIGYPVTQNKSELFFEQGLYIILRVLGLHVHAELTTSNGRIDLFIETENYIYIIELKLDKSADEALKQIEEKDYALPWKFDGKKIFKIGIGFSSSQRNITSWKIES